jgi:hypothetical protein
VRAPRVEGGRVDRELPVATLMDLSQGHQDPPQASSSSDDDARASSCCVLVSIAHSRRWLPGEPPVPSYFVAHSCRCSHHTGVAHPIPRNTKLIAWCGAPTWHGHDSARATLETATPEERMDSSEEDSGGCREKRNGKEKYREVRVGKR